MVVCRPAAVIPAKAGIQKRNATGIYRKKQKPPPRHSRAGGNPETQRGRTLSEKTETPPTVIPAKAGIQKRNATGIYRKKQKPHRPSFPQKRESKNATQQEFIGKNRNPTDRHSRKSGNPATQRSRNLSEKTETPTDRHSRKSGNPATEKPQESIRKNRNPTAVIPAKAGIQTRRHGNLPNKTVSLDSTSQIPAFAGMTRF
ncbi:TPA: hypothetical protein ACFN7P_001891 [Neisseria meningitidis]